MNSKKIAFIFSQFPCYDETFILREMNALHQAGMDMAIYSLKTPKDKIIHEEAKELAQATSYLPFFSLKLLKDDLFFLFHHPARYFSAFFGVLLRNLRSANFFFKTCCLWYKAVGFARLAREQGITHVHGQWATYPATVACIISKLNNIPFSFTGHAHDIYLDTTMLAFKMRRAKFMVTCTQDNKRYLSGLASGHGLLATGYKQKNFSSQLGAPSLEQKIIISYHGVDLERFRNEDRKWKMEDGKIKILSVGSLLECKGFNYLIEACRILKEEGIDFECTIAGGGPLLERHQSQVTSHQLENQVNFTGYITQDKLILLYKEADVFVLAMEPEIHWGIPNVIIEAMAASVPVVCTMLPSIPELIEDGKTGFIIPAKDPAAIALAIEKLYRDPDLRKRISEAGRRVVEEKFDVGKNAEQLKKLFS